jgi:hypothetical protein
MMTAAWFENNENTVGWKNMNCDLARSPSSWLPEASDHPGEVVLLVLLFESALTDRQYRPGAVLVTTGIKKGDMPWLWLIHCMFRMWNDHQMHTLTTCAIRVQWLRMQLVVSRPGLRIKLHHHSKLQPWCISPKLLAHREVVQIGIMSELFAKWPQLQVA